MTLRMRIAAAAGLAVALAVVAAVDRGLPGRARASCAARWTTRCADAPSRWSTAARAGPAGPAGPDAGAAPGGRVRQLPLDAPAEPFGGPEGYVQLVLPDGRRPAPARRRRARCR